MMGVSGPILLIFLVILTVFSDRSISAGIYGLTASMPAIGAGMWAVGRSIAAEWLPERRAQFLALGAEAVRVVERGERGGAGAQSG